MSTPYSVLDLNGQGFWLWIDKQDNGTEVIKTLIWYHIALTREKDVGSDGSLTVEQASTNAHDLRAVLTC